MEHGTPIIPKMIIIMGTDTSPVLQQSNATPIITRIIDAIRLNKKKAFGCFFSASSKYGLLLNDITSHPFL